MSINLWAGTFGKSLRLVRVIEAWNTHKAATGYSTASTPRAVVKIEPYQPKKLQLKPPSQRRHSVGASWPNVGMSWRDTTEPLALRPDKNEPPLAHRFQQKSTTPFRKDVKPSKAGAGDDEQ
jgi:hypothetical protein